MYRVYKITNNITDKIYFGYTSKPIMVRWKKHCASRRNFYILNNIKKYGSDNFSIKKLYEFETPAEAKTTEIYLIAKFQTNICKYPNGTGMNMTDGGEGVHGFHHSLESIEKMKIVQSNRSQQWKDRISKSHKGKTLSDEHKQKIGNSGKGKKWNDAQKENVTGENNHFYGKHHSATTKEQLRLSKEHTMKSVKQYDLCGNFLQLHHSIHAAGKFINTNPRNIISVCRGRSKTSCGFKWEYE